VLDPLRREVSGRWLRLSAGTALIESAEAVGLWRLAPSELDPARATSYGCGQLIRAAFDAGCLDITVGLGGSATNDGGAGMAQALGFRLLDADGSDLRPGGLSLQHLDRIEAPPHLLRRVRITAATDVVSPLLGDD